jgi:hypothetical protein
MTYCDMNLKRLKKWINYDIALATSHQAPISRRVIMTLFRLMMIIQRKYAVRASR